MGWLNFMGKLVDSMEPPMETNPIKQRRSRWRVMVAAYSALGLVIGLFLYGQGEIPGFAGYATKADITTVNNAVASVGAETKIILENSLENAIRDDLKLRCKATDPQFRAKLASDIAELEDRYYRRTGRGYQQPSCSDLL